MCDKYTDNISLYVDEMLDKSEALELENHMNTCEDCRQVYNNLLALKDMLGNMDDIEFPDDLHSNIMNAVENSKETKVENKVIKIDFRKYVAAAVSIAAFLFVFSPVISNSFYKKEPNVTLMADPVTAKQELNYIKNREFIANTVSVLVETDDKEKAKNDIIANLPENDNYTEYSNNDVTTITVQLEEDQATELVNYITTNYSNSKYSSSQENLKEDIEKVDTLIKEKTENLNVVNATEEKQKELNTEIDSLVAKKNDLFKKSQLVTVNITIK